jgi:hypothetical protein
MWFPCALWLCSVVVWRLGASCLVTNSLMAVLLPFISKKTSTVVGTSDVQDRYLHLYRRRGSPDSVQW